MVATCVRHFNTTTKTPVDNSAVSIIRRRPKRSLPSPDEGVMTFIPKDKARILHILQTECDILPDQVFPLFPDRSTQTILADNEDWSQSAIEFSEAADAAASTAAEQSEDEEYTYETDDDDDDDDEEYESDDEQEQDNTINVSSDSSSSDGPLQLAQIDTAQIALSSSNNNVFIPSKQQSHPIWQKDPDNVFEMIHVLRSLGFKSSQTAAVWPYNTTSIDADSEPEQSDDDEDEDASEPVALNDFYLMFARFPELLSMDVEDVRRKLLVFEEFGLDDMRLVLLKDPRILRRAPHHIRWLLEVWDDFFVEDTQNLLQLSPHFLASTSKKELHRRLCFVYKEIIEPYKEYNETPDPALWHKNMQKQLVHLKKNSEYVIKNGVAIQKNKEVNKEMVYGVYFDDHDKTMISDFIMDHADFIGNASVDRMKKTLWLLRKMGIKGKELNALLYAHPQVLTVSPRALMDCVDNVKRSGERNYRQWVIDHVDQVIEYAHPVEKVFVTGSQEMASK